MPSWMRNYRKYKQLVKSLIFEKTELDFAEEISDEIDMEFDSLQREYLLKNNIDLELYPNAGTPSAIPPSDSTGIVKVKEKTKSNIKHFSPIYKLIAKKIHPDKFANMPRTDEVIEKEEMFKKAVTAYKSSDWATFLGVAESLDIRPIKLSLLLSELPREIEKLQNRTKKIKNTWGWALYECNDDQDCKDKLMRRAMKQIYNI